MYSKFLDYTEKVKDHFFNPRNFVKEEDVGKLKYDGVSQVGSPACGDVMKMWIEVDEKAQKITSLKWQTYGCVSAIASTSVLSEMVLRDGGMKIEEALKIKPKDIIAELGSLPEQKVHCSVLGDQVLVKAINNYLGKEV